MRLLRHPRAVEDLIEIMVYLRREGGERLARKFLLSLEETLEFLTHTPRAGKEVDLEGITVVGLRLWHVEQFPKYLIFYRISGNRLEILRVLHGMRDWRKLLLGE